MAVGPLLPREPRVFRDHGHSPFWPGRGITAEDRADAPEVVVVSESLAEQHFPGEDPVGRRLRWGREEDQPPVEIVGVVGDVQHYTLGQTSIPQVYVPFAQRPATTSTS